jgi:hypothetical protein
LEEISTEDAKLIYGPVAVRRQPPTGGQSVSIINAERDVCIADIDHK